MKRVTHKAHGFSHSVLEMPMHLKKQPVVSKGKSSKLLIQSYWEIALGKTSPRFNRFLIFGHSSTSKNSNDTEEVTLCAKR